MDLENIKALAAELAKNVKTEKDLNTLTQQLLKMTVETALNTELSEHLGYEKNQPKPKGNARNGYTPKTLKSQVGEVEIATPRDREGSFEPQLLIRPVEV